MNVGVFSLCYFLHFLFICIICVHLHNVHAWVWRSKDGFVESVLSFHLYICPGIEFRSSGLQGKHFYTLSHLVSPYMLPLRHSLCFELHQMIVLLVYSNHGILLSTHTEHLQTSPGSLAQDGQVRTPWRAKH